LPSISADATLPQETVLLLGSYQQKVNKHTASSFIKISVKEDKIKARGLMSNISFPKKV
jgi:hypothetical protein